MEWRRQPTADPTDPNGVADLLARACGPEHGGIVEGTRFLFRTADMLAASRDIERSALLEPDVPLYVGVQLAHRLEAQREIYEPLIDEGVSVHAFGTDEAPDMGGVVWTKVPEDGLSLESQWFVVRGGRNPRALVGFELPAGADRRRRWEGFVSSDAKLVERMTEHLQALTASAQGVDA